MNPMERFRANLKMACTLKIEPEMWFSPNLENYVRHLASYYQVDAHAMVLAIINGVATTCRSTYLNRASQFLVPCNLFNLVIARSGYSKSNILDLAELIAETAEIYFHQFEDNKEIDEGSTEKNSSEQSGSCAATTTTATTNLLNPKNFRKNSTKVVFNDGTSAGILNNLKQCTRTMHLHEADVTLKSFGLILPSPFDITPTKIDTLRSTLMTLYEKPGHFCRVLKKEKINISGSKLNIFGASTGDLIASELVRLVTYSSADALFERFILWPLDGEPISNEQCITAIDCSQYCSSEQFAILCEFVADLILELAPDGKNILADQALQFRIAGSKSDVEDNVSARLNKMTLASYRIAGLCGLAEAAFDLIFTYINHYVTFGDGQADEAFFHRSAKIAEMRYGTILRKEQNFIINTEICNRAQNVIAQNLAQYVILMKISPDDRKSWSGSSGRNIRSIMRTITTNEDHESVESIDTLQSSIDFVNKTMLPLTRKQKNMILLNMDKPSDVLVYRFNQAHVSMLRDLLASKEFLKRINANKQLFSKVVQMVEESNDLHEKVPESNNLHGMVPDSNDTALLLIDVINHLDFEGNEELLKVAEKIGKRIAALKAAARKAGIPVVYVNDNFGRWNSDFHNVIKYVINENKPGRPLAELLRPEEDDYFVLKPKHSAFYCTPLDILLNHLDAETLILAGFAGNICVLFTANDAYMRNFKLIIPRDCIGSNTSEENEACLEQMTKLLKADTRPSAEIIKEIEKQPKIRKTDAERAKTPKKVIKK